MNILIACQFFDYCSGSAMYAYDLAVELKKRGNTVTILSAIGGEISNLAIQAGIRLVDNSQIFDIKDEKFDVLHLNQWYPAELALEYFPTVPAVFTIHSELSIEKPYIAKDKIMRYIGIRPSVCTKYADLEPVLIWNGIDFSRFNTSNEDVIMKKKIATKMQKEILLFVGTIDGLRANAISDLMQSESKGKELWLVGKNMLPFPVPPEKAKILPETFFVEKWTEMADICAGIMIGRTAIEAWACGKPYLCYTVTDSGAISAKELMLPPADMSKYDIRHMTDSIERIYKQLTS